MLLNLCCSRYDTFKCLLCQELGCSYSFDHWGYGQELVKTLWILCWLVQPSSLKSVPPIFIYQILWRRRSPTWRTKICCSDDNGFLCLNTWRNAASLQEASGGLDAQTLSKTKSSFISDDSVSKKKFILNGNDHYVELLPYRTSSTKLSQSYKRSSSARAAVVRGWCTNAYW